MYFEATATLKRPLSAGVATFRGFPDEAMKAEAFAPLQRKRCQGGCGSSALARAVRRQSWGECWKPCGVIFEA